MPKEKINPQTGEVTVLTHRKGKNLDNLGREIPDPVPVAPPVGYKPRDSMWDVMYAQIRREQGIQDPRKEEDVQSLDDFEEEDDVFSDFPDDPNEVVYQPTPPPPPAPSLSDEIAAAIKKSQSGGEGAAAPSEGAVSAGPKAR